MKKTTIFFSLLICLLVTGCSLSTREINITTLDFSTEFPAGQPYLYQTNEGNIIMSWTETDAEGRNYLRYSTYDNNLWSKATTIASGGDWFVNWADFPSVVKHPNGGILSHYLEKSGPGTFAYDVKLAGITVKGEHFSTTLHDDSTQTEHGFVSIVPYEDNYFISWLDGRNTATGMHTDHSSHDHGGGPMSLRGAIITAEGRKVNEWVLDERVCDCCQTSATVTSDGIVVVYRDRTENEIRDISVVKYDGANWSAPVQVHNDGWEIKGCPVNGPKVVAKDQTVAVAWFTASNNTPKVQMKISKDGGNSFSEPIAINHASAIGRVGLIIDQENNIFVSWMEHESDIALLKVKKIDNKGRVLKKITVEAVKGARETGFPQIALAKNGTLLVAWTTITNGNKGIKVVSII